MYIYIYYINTEYMYNYVYMYNFICFLVVWSLLARSLCFVGSVFVGVTWRLGGLSRGSFGLLFRDVVGIETLGMASPKNSRSLGWKTWWITGKPQLNISSLVNIATQVSSFEFPSPQTARRIWQAAAESRRKTAKAWYIYIIIYMHIHTHYLLFSFITHTHIYI